MADGVPNVTFDWLGALPARMEAASQEEATKKALASLKSGDYQSVRQTAAQLLASGGNPDLAVKLLTAATADYAARQRAEETRLYYQALPGVLERQKGQPQVGPAQLPAQLPAPPNQSGYNPTPGIWPAPPPVSGPQGALAPEVPAPQQAAEAPQQPSPSEAVLARAESGMAPSLTPATKLAGPPPTPDTSAKGDRYIPPPPPREAPPQAAPQLGNIPVAPGTPQGLPPGLMSGSINVQQPVGAIVNPPGGPVGAPQPGVPQSPLEQLQGVKSALEGQLALLPRTAAGSPEGQQILTQYKQIVNQMGAINSLTPKELEYSRALIQDMQAGKQFYTRTEYDNMNDLQKNAYDKMFIPAANEYRTQRLQAESVLGTTRRLMEIVNNPSNRSGLGQSTVNSAVNLLTTLNKVVTDAGLPGLDIESIKGLQGAQQAQRLAELAGGLTNLLTIQRLGGLGRQISDADRDYMARAFYNLSNSVEGNKLILKMTADLAEQAVKSGQAAADYQRATPNTRANVTEMDDAVRRQVDLTPVFRDKDGKLTPLGEKYNAEINKIIGVPETYTGGIPTLKPGQGIPPGYELIPGTTRLQPKGGFNVYDPITHGIIPMAPARGSAQPPTYSPSDLPGAARGTPPPTPLQNRYLRRPIRDENGLLLQPPGGG